MTYKSKLASLRYKAQVACKLRGHDMRPFEQSDWYKATKRYSTCCRCDMQVAINAQPAANEIDIGGEAVALNCKA